ncbi:MAG TPA: DUF4173 domain-containing protein [Nocardioidaceae bacterium]|nr:DUF4173 domain-containing protein [Nocardioidaceae bacterium]
MSAPPTNLQTAASSWPGQLWPERRSSPGAPFLVAALGVGLFAAAVLPDSSPGIATFLVLAACEVVAGGAFACSGRPRTAYQLGCGLLCLLLLAPLFLLDALWVVALCVLAAAAVTVGALVDARTLTGIVASAFAVPLATLRGLPWLGRGLSVARRFGAWGSVVRTLAISAGLLLVFGALFASADALFSSWAGALVPDVSAEWFALRGFLLVAFTGLSLAGVYVASNPPVADRLSPPQPSRHVRTFEWLVPVGVLDVMFALFVAAQATAMFGGRGYVRRTTGLSYADYVHQGFAQLTVVTALTLLVVAGTSHVAEKASPRDRALLRVALGALTALTLVVVASALLRMHIYEEAFGFTRLRLLVSVFEGWLGIVVVLVMLAGFRLRGSWVPRTMLISGAVALLALASVNPDAMIASHNLDRYRQTGRIDAGYLAELSSDAAPLLAGRWRGFDVCASGGEPSSGLSWNLSRARAAHLRDAAGCG